MEAQIQLRVNKPITTKQYIDLIKETTLISRRPIDDIECIKGMLSNANLLISAWSGLKLVGLSRCVTDFHYCCYLSDLAVIESFQQQGIGKLLIERTKRQLGKKCKIILLAAPGAESFYKQEEFKKHTNAWVLDSRA